jgi:hypothetical protein
MVTSSATLTLGALPASGLPPDERAAALPSGHAWGHGCSSTLETLDRARVIVVLSPEATRPARWACGPISDGARPCGGVANPESEVNLHR